jgi:hypothetical protein
MEKKEIKIYNLSNLPVEDFEKFNDLQGKLKYLMVRLMKCELI